MTCHFLLTDGAAAIPTRLRYQIGLRIKGSKPWDGARNPSKTGGSSLVAVVHLGGDSLFELGELVLRERAGEDLRTPFDEVVHHVADRVKHLAPVPLSAGEDG